MTWLKNFSEKHPIVFSATALIIAMVIGLFVHNDLIEDSIITVICLLLIFGAGLYGTSGLRTKGLLKGIKLGCIFIIIGIGGAVISLLGADFSVLKIGSAGTIAMFTLTMILVGINEELLMRSLILNNLLTAYGKTHSGMWKSILIAALMFGALHLPNFAFTPPITLIVQIINASSAALLFAAVYIRSKNIWSGIILHFIVDWLSLFVSECFTGGGASVISMDMNIPQGVTMVLLASTPPIVMALILLRKNKFEPWDAEEK